MRDRVIREAQRVGLELEGLDLLGRALDLAMTPRRAALPDDHHPAFLRPGRVVLVLLSDTPERSPGILAAAALTESLDASLRCLPRAVEEALGSRIEELRRAVPTVTDGEEDHLERLVSAPLELARVALAEHLDHLRHLHLERDATTRERMCARALDLWLPVARRTDPVLERRFRWWCTRVAPRM